MKQFTILLLALALFSCEQEKKQTYTVVGGTVENNTAENVLIRGTDFEAKLPISLEGTFLDTLTLQNDGFYQLYVGRERAEIYLEKGQNLTVNLNTEEFDESLKYSGDLANPNNFLAQKYLWNEKNLDFKYLFTRDEDSFLDKLNADQKALDSLYASHNIKNDNFKKMLAEEDKYSKASLIENYQSAHSYYTMKPEFQVSQGFYESLNDINFSDTLAFRNSASYQNLLSVHFNRVASKEALEGDNSEHTLYFLKSVNEALPDGYAKDKLMYDHLQFGLKADRHLGENYDIYVKSNPNPKNLAKLTERYNLLKSLMQGEPSPTFDFENHKGGTTSLDDLKGKYVYIDVWATWCGPCLREIPSLKEIEEEYRGKNIQFVSISIDEPKDYEKWRAMVTEKSLVGIQLMADNNWESKFVKEYGILGIPRFILLDPKGNIVNADAPRPSDLKLKEVFDSLL